MKLKTLFGLPKKVVFCKKSLISNQRPTSAVEFKTGKKQIKKTLFIDKNGISDSWKYSRTKLKINYDLREKKLLRLLDKHRGKYGKFDCIVPGSGGKDSCYATHILKNKYGMSPLTVTWPPILYTEYGYKNYQNWLRSDRLSNITPKRDEFTMRYLTKLAMLNLMHPFQTFILGQKIFAKSEAEHGNPKAYNNKSLRDNSYSTYKNFDEIHLGGVQIKSLIDDHRLTYDNLKIFLPPEEKELLKSNTETHYLGYYLKWIPQETYYYAVKNCKFRPRPFRTQGTYCKYTSIDDKIDDFHFYTTFIKFGIGRATYDASQELRNNHISIEEGKKLIKKYDGEFPKRYFKEVLDYLEIKESVFLKTLDNFRSPHLWKKIKNKWFLRHTVNKDGLDDN